MLYSYSVWTHTHVESMLKCGWKGYINEDLAQSDK